MHIPNIPADPHADLDPTLEFGIDAKPATVARAIVRGAAARGSRGMTLIEILVVLAIIGLIMGGVAIVAFNQFDDAKLKTAAKDIATLSNAVDMYRLQKNKCPKTTQDLKTAGIIPRVTKDPWGGDYEFKCPGEHGNVDISSAGKDGEMGNDDDIRSWDEDLGQSEDEDN